MLREAFTDLKLSAAVLRGLCEFGFARPSPIQARAIPLGRFGVDLIAQAKSGTGKTCVFAVVALELVHRGGPRVLIIAPTREIALQSRDVCCALGSHMFDLSCHAFIGGIPMRADVSSAARCQLACGTPGRMIGLLLCEAFVANRVGLLVLDEADKLCDDDFEPQLGYLCLPTLNPCAVLTTSGRPDHTSPAAAAAQARSPAPTQANSCFLGNVSRPATRAPAQHPQLHPALYPHRSHPSPNPRCIAPDTIQLPAWSFP